MKELEEERSETEKGSGGGIDRRRGQLGMLQRTERRRVDLRSDRVWKLRVLCIVQGIRLRLLEVIFSVQITAEMCLCKLATRRQLWGRTARMLKLGSLR